MSFHAGASGVPDALRPAHLRSLVARGSVEAGSSLLSVLNNLVSVMMRDEVPQFVVPILYGANECDIRKKESGLKASLPGSRRRSEAGPIGGLNQWGMRGGSACVTRLCQGLSPQKGPSEDQHA